MPRIRLRVALLVPVALAALLILPHLGGKPFWDYDEAIYANVIHDSQASGNVFALSRLDRPFFEKPPLYFWSSMLFGHAFERPELAYRLTAALSGILTVALVVLIGWEVSGSIVALAGGLVLATTAVFIEASRQVRLDVPAVAAIMLAVYCFLRGRKDPRWLAGIGIAIAIGILFKSVIALLAGVYMLIWSLVESEWGWLRDRYLWLGALGGTLVLLPWHLYESVRYGGAFWNGYFWHNVIDRVGGDILGGTQTLSDYARFFFWFAAPWSIVVVLVALYALILVRQKQLSDGSRQLLAFTFTTLAIAALFSASSTRIFYYLLPVYPFLAVAVALALSEVIARVGPRIAGGIFLVLLSGGLWVSVHYAAHDFALMHVNDIISADEAAAGASIRTEPETMPVYAYQHDYWDTFSYYSGGRRIEAMTDDAVLDRPFFLLVSTPFMQTHSFDPALEAHLAARYQGEVVTLFEFHP